MEKKVRLDLVDTHKLEFVVGAIDLLMKDLLDLKDEINPIIHSKSISKFAARLSPTETDVEKIKRLIISFEINSNNLKRSSKEALASLEASLETS